MTMDSTTFIRRVTIRSAQQIFAWRPVVTSLTSIALMWGSYLILGLLLADPSFANTAPAWGPDLYARTFAVLCATSGLAYMAACFRSALPATVALVASTGLIVAGLQPFVGYALVLAILGVVVYRFGYMFHGGNVAATSAAVEQ